MTDIVFKSAIQLAADIRARRISASELLDAHLAQIDACNPELNAVVTMDADGARERAKEADDALARGESWGPLHGVPFTLKDCFATAGMRTTCGFPPLAEYVPEQDSTVTARLKDAGGVLVGKTNVAMLLNDYQTNNPVFGRTSNPWNLERTPGGSSGGAAAAVASGMTPFELGTDLSGSLRVPAHYCGLFALKPTEHRVSLDGIVAGDPRGPRPIRVMSCTGPMARSVEDLALIYRIIAGPDGRDTDVPAVPIDDLPRIDIETLRVAVAPTLPGFPVAAMLRQTVEELAALLEPECQAIEVAALPQLDAKRLFEPAEMALGAFQPGKESAPLSQYLEALDRRDKFINAWEQFFDEWDVLLCPPSMMSAFPHCEQGAPLDVDGHEESYWMAQSHSTWFNYTGHPAVVLPVTLDGDGLPVGVQLVGKRWGESRLLAIAQTLSEMTGEFQPPPGY